MGNFDGSGTVANPLGVIQSLKKIGVIFTGGPKCGGAGFKTMLIALSQGRITEEGDQRIYEDGNVVLLD